MRRPLAVTLFLLVSCAAVQAAPREEMVAKYTRDYAAKPAALFQVMTSHPYGKAGKERRSKRVQELKQLRDAQGGTYTAEQQNELNGLISEANNIDAMIEACRRLGTSCTALFVPPPISGSDAHLRLKEEALTKVRGLHKVPASVEFSNVRSIVDSSNKVLAICGRASAVSPNGTAVKNDFVLSVEMQKVYLVDDPKAEGLGRWQWNKHCQQRPTPSNLATQPEAAKADTTEDRARWAAEIANDCKSLINLPAEHTRCVRLGGYAAFLSDNKKAAAPPEKEPDKQRVRCETRVSNFGQAVDTDCTKF